MNKKHTTNARIRCPFSDVKLFTKQTREDVQTQERIKTDAEKDQNKMCFDSAAVFALREEYSCTRNSSVGRYTMSYASVVTIIRCPPFVTWGGKKTSSNSVPTSVGLSLRDLFDQEDQIKRLKMLYTTVDFTYFFSLTVPSQLTYAVGIF